MVMRLFERYRCDECGFDINASSRPDVPNKEGQAVCCSRCGAELKTLYANPLVLDRTFRPQGPAFR